MFRSTPSILSVLILVGLSACQVNAQGFWLSGDDYLLVDTSYFEGYLRDRSRVDVVIGGNVVYISPRHTSTVCISGGEVHWIEALDSSAVDVSGGEVSWLDAYAYSTVAISDGVVRNFKVSGLSQSGGQRVVLSGGTVDTLTASVRLENDEELNFDGLLTPDLLARYGVEIAGGIVSNPRFASVDVQGSGTIRLSGGRVFDIFARDSGAVDISGGHVTYLGASDGSSLTISGGEVDRLETFTHSTATITGGNVSRLEAHDSSTVVFHVRDFVLGPGIWMEGNRLMGYGGLLGGTWFDGTSWETEIWLNHGATVLLVPEPPTMIAFAGGLIPLFGVRRRRA